LDAGAQLGVTGPGCCLQPGTTSSFFARWLGNDLPGTATLWGETFTGLGNPSRPNNASIEYQSSMFSLPSTGGTSLTITAPFMLNGLLFGRSPTDGTQVAASFIGSGTGMMPLTWIPSLDAWAPGTVQEQVSTPPGLVPEPSTFLLAGTALLMAVVCWRARSKHLGNHGPGAERD
jgi:hypothetical protein